MATVRRRLKKKHVCSCGRSFAHAISLKRHRFVSGCEEGEAGDEATPEEATDKKPSKKVEEPVQEEIALPPQTLTVEQIQALQTMANARLSPTPTVGYRIQRAALAAGHFGLEFFSWLFSETQNVASWGRNNVLPAAGNMVRQAFLSVMTVAVLSVVFFSGISMGLSARQAAAEAAPTTGPVRAVDAAQTVVDFYRAVNAEAYSAAYARLSPQWQSELSLVDFASGYAPVRHINCRVTDLQTLDSQRALVAVELDVYEAGQMKKFRGHYTVVYNGVHWSLDASHLTL